MIQLKLQTLDQIKALTAIRKGEIKLGEKVSVINSLDELRDAPGNYVIFGICEDIGVQANFGRPGARHAWDAFLGSFLNVQYPLSLHEKNTEPCDIIILGHIRVTPDQNISKKTPKELLGSIVERIDKKVAELVQRIVETGKFPIIIGGGHNNAFGNLKGSSQALKMPINAINIDAHTDLRTTDYRHSGNGFTYALENEEGSYLNHYTIYGLHKNYTPQYIFDYIHRRNTSIKYYSMDEMLTFEQQQHFFKEAVETVNNAPFGIELDCDSIVNFPSSAQTPSGFTLEAVRLFMQTIGASKNSVYMHICEAAPQKKKAMQVGKALTYLVSDFIRSHHENNTL